MTQADEFTAGEARGLLPRFTLKDGDTFLLADALGDIQANEDGLFSSDTRILSRLELLVAGRRPSLLGAAISQDNTLFTSHLTNRPLPALGERAIPKGVIHIERCRFLCIKTLYERLRFTNFSAQDAQLPVTLSFAADFADIFEVQGHVRQRRGENLPPQVSAGGVRLAYRGLDEKLRTTEIRCAPAPRTLTGHEAGFVLDLPRNAVAELFVEIGIDSTDEPSQERFAAALQSLSRSMRQRVQEGAALGSSGRLFNEWIERSRFDLALLTTTLSTGPYPYAGIPWFSTPFGRDGIITAWQTLWLDPGLAARRAALPGAHPGTRHLRVPRLRARQDHARDAPRRDGSAARGAVRAVLRRRRHHPAVRHAGRRLRASAPTTWRSSTASGTTCSRLRRGSKRGSSAVPAACLDYARGETTGLANQGWKDSERLDLPRRRAIPQGPIALVEVQGYAYAALMAMATLAARRGDRQRSAQWHSRAQQLLAAVEARFWMDDMGFYAIALDGEGQLCRVRASNAGHLLLLRRRDCGARRTGGR